MNAVELTYLREWIGRVTVDKDMLSVRHARLMAATIGTDTAVLEAGRPLPPLWHWLYFLEGLPPEQLGRDGHPARGGFMPPVPLPNRMWAGGQVDFYRPLPLGAEVEKRSTIASVEQKQGRSGELVFVTVRHEVFHDGELAVAENHDVVYKEASKPGGSPVVTDVPVAFRTETFVPSSTMLFRYSALTFNGHRIHYDQDYSREVEGYPNLVIHGPLNATLLARFAEQVVDRPVRRFVYRGVQPAILGNTLTINAAWQSDGLALWTGLLGGLVSMKATATF